MTARAKELRKIILEISHKVKSAHIGSNLSCADIFSALYFNVLNLQTPFNEKTYQNRDIFILSKAHSALALYVSLYLKGAMSEKELNGYYIDNGLLPAHTDRKINPFVEISAGSLGHGLPIALGIAMAIKNQKNDLNAQRRVFCLMGDGEIEEGSVWEANMLASKLELSHLIALVDFNNLQGYGRATELVNFEPLVDKYQAFGWNCVDIDGHDEIAIIKAIDEHKKSNSKKPLCVICRTIKGKGVSFMEDRLEWHYYAIGDEEYQKALEELK